MKRAAAFGASAASALSGRATCVPSVSVSLASLARAPPCPIGAMDGSRGYATVTRRRRKELAREKAANMRSLLAFAARYDHMRTARLELSQTLKRLGWVHNSGEQIADGVFADYTLRDHYCAFTLVDESHYVSPGHVDASDVPGMPPLPRDDEGRILMPHESPYPAAPAPWKNPVLGMMLDKATAAQHATIRGKGWSLVAIPLPLWREARASAHQHYARRDLVMQMTLPLAPFELRPVSLSGFTGGGK